MLSLKDDPDTVLKCLMVSSNMLEKMNRKGMTPTLSTLKEELFFEGVQNEDPLIRNEALRNLGYLALLDEDFACQHLVLFLQVKKSELSNFVTC